jgi:hypothetical protein
MLPPPRPLVPTSSFALYMLPADAPATAIAERRRGYINSFAKSDYTLYSKSKLFVIQRTNNTMNTNNIIMCLSFLCQTKGAVKRGEGEPEPWRVS